MESLLIDFLKFSYGPLKIAEPRHQKSKPESQAACRVGDLTEASKPHLHTSVKPLICAGTAIPGIESRVDP
jgi:hypothetical protein